jgi:cysteine desulfurase
MIYLDNNATTPLCPEAKQAWLEICSLPLNESSVHQLGRQAKAYLRQSSEIFARFFNLPPEQILFTSSATEAINAFFYSFCQGGQGHILAGITEHAATLETLKKWACQGWNIEFIPVDPSGAYDPDQILKRLRPDTKLVTLMATNNETGVNQSLASLGLLLKSKGIETFVDAVASAGKTPFSWFEGLTAAVISAHKFHGPIGTAALGMRPGFKWRSMILGGAQQRGRRAGTFNIPLLVASAKALEIFLQDEAHHLTYIESLRSGFENELTSLLMGVEVNGSAARASNVSNLYFEGVEAETLVMQLDHLGVLVSQGSACQSGASEPSHVIQAMHGLQRAKSSVRFSFSRMNTHEEVAMAVQKIKQAVDFQRSLS